MAVENKVSSAKVELVLNAIRGGKCKNHESIRRAISKMGENVSQPEISRVLTQEDVAKVVKKVDGLYVATDKSYQDLMRESFTSHFAQFVEEINCDVEILAVKTTPGMGRAVSIYLEGSFEKEIFGSVYHDSMVLFATKSKKRLKESIEALMPAESDDQAETDLE